jgi:PAS domain S-box-containing protein
MSIEDERGRLLADATDMAIDARHGHAADASAWTRIVRARPTLRHLAAFTLAYVACAGFAAWLAVNPGTGISIWPPSGLFIATLVMARRASMPWWLLAGAVAEALANLFWFRNPIASAGLFYAGNALCALLGAALLERLGSRPYGLETLRNVALLILAAVVAPVVSATVGASTLATLQGQPFARSWPLWWLGDLTGILILAPLVFSAVQGWRERSRLAPRRVVEAAALAALLVGLAALSLGGHLPYAYIVMPPMLWAAIRFEIRGAVLSVVLLACMAALFTVEGVSPFSGDADSPQDRYVMLQLFLAISALSTLLVAAIARQYRLAREALQEQNELLESRVESRTADLRRSEDRLRLALRAGGMGVWRWNPVSGESEVDDALRTLAGLHEQEARADAVAAFRAHIHGDDLPRLEADVERAVREGGQFQHEFRYRHPDGRTLWMAGYGLAVRADDGTFLYLTGVNFDITARRQADDALRESRYRLQTLTDNLPDVVARFDRQLRHVFVNAAVERVTGRDAPSFIGRTNRELGMPVARCDEWDSALLAVFDSGVPGALQFEINGPGGTRHFEGRLIPELDAQGRVEHVLAITTDITERVLAQRVLGEADRRKDEFLAIVAHELRNPLAAIRNAGHLLQAVPAHSAAFDRAVGMIDRQSLAMSRIIDDLMDANRIGRGEVALRRERVDLCEVLRIALDTSRALVDERRHTVQLSVGDMPLWAQGDAARLAQVFTNLLTNAARYTPAGGRIALTLRPDDGHAVVSVKDSGIGIAADQLPLLFRLYSRLASEASPSRPGLGIGLSLAKQIVEMHGGSIEARSDGPGLGSEFIVRLPALCDHVA